MTPQEEQWLAKYRQQQAGERIKQLYRTLGFWAIFAVCYLTVLFSGPGEKFSFMDSLFTIAIILNVGNCFCELHRNKRITTSGNAPSGDAHRQ